MKFSRSKISFSKRIFNEFKNFLFLDIWFVTHLRKSLCNTPGTSVIHNIPLPIKLSYEMTTASTLNKSRKDMFSHLLLSYSFSSTFSFRGAVIISPGTNFCNFLIEFFGYNRFEIESVSLNKGSRLCSSFVIWNFILF